MTIKLADHTRHQIALRLLPFLFILYITNYLDRTSVAYAAIGMSRTLGFNDRVFGLGAGIFFISYVALQIPGALMIERWSARRCISFDLNRMGIVDRSDRARYTPRVNSTGARLMLGAAEAAFFPGVVVYLSHWFIREDRAKAGSNFMAAIPLSFIVGSPLAGWILGHPWLGVDGWRWMFLLEGMPAVLLGVVAFFYLTDWPREAAWLAPEQRRWIEQKLEEEKPVSQRPIGVWQALRSRPILLLASVAFLQYFVYYTLYLLDAHHVEAAIGILRYASRAAGHGPLPGGFGRHVDQRMAFGQNGRTTLALGGSAVRSGIDVSWADHATGLDGNNDDSLYHACAARKPFCLCSGRCQPRFSANRLPLQVWEW